MKLKTEDKVIVTIVTIGLTIAGIIIFSKLRAEVVMCQTYYPEMGTWDCYWSPKVLPQRSGR